MTDSTLQLTYLARPNEAYEGQPEDMNPKDKVTKRCETAAGIGFGLAVSYGTGDEDAVLGGTNPVGITIRDWQSEEGKYEQNDEMSVLTKGRIYVKIATAQAAGAALKYVQATGVLDAGAPIAGETAIPGKLERTTTAVNQIAPVSLG
jgi:hypothetical protein